MDYGKDNTCNYTQWHIDVNAPSGKKQIILPLTFWDEKNFIDLMLCKTKKKQKKKYTAVNV